MKRSLLSFSIFDANSYQIISYFLSNYWLISIYFIIKSVIFCLLLLNLRQIILSLSIERLPHQTAMKQQKYRTADDQLHHTAIPLQKVVLFDELGMHAEEQSAEAVAAKQEAAA